MHFDTNLPRQKCCLAKTLQFHYEKFTALFRHWVGVTIIFIGVKSS